MMYQAINSNTGQVVIGNTVAEAYELMLQNSLDGDKIFVKSYKPTYNLDEVKKLIEIMQGYDPNGFWNETDYADPEDIKVTLEQAVVTLNRWIKYDVAKDDVLSQRTLQHVIWDIEKILAVK